ncbi:MAG: DUF302 domain-containing protein [Candidatus Krumholzibacteria bacterium]|nr:DUF302 domain-containing protein [Candidatus Krumholzibacteria bacterium]MDH4335757.1 DUF302 domain-containing protein [Candidatus Krumholzibacteria bacterium]MDH5269283.1 DUF302 domain-containing protein [Candidatus Krumholzibacteria bacterium]MDH5626998.1 DUF302 domain-containing protein [Candidatus Krumholzibacteria bacterium]
MNIGIKKNLSISFDEALAAVPEALKAEGFGILTEIDVQKTLDEKLHVPFRRYRILGACNPPLAHRVLTAETDAGVMLPCNVIVYEGDDGRAVVTAVDPMQTLAREHPVLEPVAREVQEKLTRVVEKLR